MIVSNSSNLKNILIKVFIKQKNIFYVSYHRNYIISYLF